ncbi:MAG: hypothetical protein R3192_13105 [Woeseiaceae bacterium]|nr:hypothetical protein [Woeseiaceae bacterium]
MNATDIAFFANISEIFGTVIVVISLVYVGVQVRQNTRTQQVHAAQNFVGIYNTFTSDLTRPDLATLWYKGIQSFHQLQEGEAVQFSALAGQLMRVFESAYLQWRAGALEDQLWQASIKSIRDTLAMPGFGQWWEFRKSWYSEDYRLFIDTIAASSGDSSPIYPGIQTK